MLDVSTSKMTNEDINNTLEYMNTKVFDILRITKNKRNLN